MEGGGRMTAKDLTQEQREWFVANFADTKNQELADRDKRDPTLHQDGGTGRENGNQV